MYNLNTLVCLNCKVSILILINIVAINNLEIANNLINIMILSYDQLTCFWLGDENLKQIEK